MQPLAPGGKSTDGNVQPLCQHCHLAKTRCEALARVVVAIGGGMATDCFRPHPAPLGGPTIRRAHHIPQNNAGRSFSVAAPGRGRLWR
ncbi:HNH endonuclease [Streptomyces sp. NPDC050508]|uniref:HNH endonuclease n=1 Tax=Streptomyces sp. NPDC050508 TaxID=3155405 RepID=UPI003446ED5E